MNPLESWHEEQRSAYLYRICAEAEAGTTRAEMFRRLAGEAEAQAAIWRAQLTARGHAAPAPYAPDLRTRVVAGLVRRLGPERLKSVLAAMKVRGMAIYTTSIAREPGHAVPGTMTTIEHRHRGLGGGGNLRAAVFGVNDGLVSNASLILGVAGASPDPHTVLITGIAGMTAGAFAMAAGEYVSVQSQRELYDAKIAEEREQLPRRPQEEVDELARIYHARGLPLDLACRISKALSADEKVALATHAREELGLDPDDLGSPLGAAGSSFVSFALGAFVPVVPFLFRAGAPFTVAAALAAAALFTVGAATARLTGQAIVQGGARLLLVGGGAGVVAYLIGRLLGVSV